MSDVTEAGQEGRWRRRSIRSSKMGGAKGATFERSESFLERGFVGGVGGVNRDRNRL